MMYTITLFKVDRYSVTAEQEFDMMVYFLLLRKINNFSLKLCNNIQGNLKKMYKTIFDL